MRPGSSAGVPEELGGVGYLPQPICISCNFTESEGGHVASHNDLVGSPPASFSLLKPADPGWVSFHLLTFATRPSSRFLTHCFPPSLPIWKLGARMGSFNGMEALPPRQLFFLQLSPSCVNRGAAGANGRSLDARVGMSPHPGPLPSAWALGNASVSSCEECR